MNKTALLLTKFWLCLLAFALLAISFMPVSTDAQNKGDSGSGRGVPPPPNPVPPAPIPGGVPPVPKLDKPDQQNQQNQQSSQSRPEMKELDIKWRTEKLAESFQLAQKEKKPAVIYFYFSEREKFPPNYDEKLAAYSTEKFIFAKIHVKKGKKDEILDKRIDVFFADNKLEKKGVAVVLDQYGNLIDKLSVPVPSAKLLDFLEKAERTIEDMGKSLKKQWERVEKLKGSGNRKELIKELNQINQTNWRGYEEFSNAGKELNELSAPLRSRLKEIIKQYMANDKDREENRKATLEQMNALVRDCKDLPVEFDVREAIDKVKKGEAFPDDEKDAVENKPKPEAKEAPPESSIDGSSGDLEPVESE
jgi:hypothetical protein